MNIINKLNIQNFHEAKIKDHGSDSAKSLGWFSEEGQIKRFDILTHSLDLNNASILDVGCGNGDLCLYLSDKYEGFTYSGIDLVSSFLDNAIEQNENNPMAKFYLGDFMSEDLTPADYVLLSGSLNYKNSDPDFIFKAILKLFGLSNIAFGFNLLSKVMDSDGILRSYSPNIILDYCQSLSSQVELIDDYHEGDYTVIMRR